MFLNKVNIEDDDLYINEKVKNFHIDIVLKRIQLENSDKTITRPILIEAKRCNLVNKDLIKKTVSHGAFQKAGIDKDILKLRLIRKYNKLNNLEFYNYHYDDIFTYLLVWGEGDNSFDPERDVINKLDYSKYIESAKCDTRRIPLTWSDDCHLVTSFIWISLLSVKAD